MKLRILITGFLIVCSTSVSAELTWGFKSPAFHYGNGYSSHVLSVEQLQHNRKQDLADKADAEAKRLERELENTTLNKCLQMVSRTSKNAPPNSIKNSLNCLFIK